MTKYEIQTRLENYNGERKEIIKSISKRIPDNYELYNFSPTTWIAECILDYTWNTKEYNEIYNIIENLLN